MKRRYYLYIIMYLLIGLTWTGCDVHEFPEAPEKVPLHIKLNYECDMTEWHHRYENSAVVEHGIGESSSYVRPFGSIRYIVRVFPQAENVRSSHNHIHEFEFTRDIADGYDCHFDLDIIPGNHTIQIWSDLKEHSSMPHFHNVDNFTEISLAGEHLGNTDYRDAFRGTGNITLTSDILEKKPDTLSITMNRPLAKYEFITTDLQEFIGKELEYLTQLAASRGDDIPTRVPMDNYKVVFYYSGFMPNTYDIHSDKPVDSALGVSFESSLDVLNDTSTSLGFDYVFVNGKESGVSVQVGLYDKTGREISLSNPVNVPLRRSHHTIIRGSFLLQQASGGLLINPEFDGNINVVLP